MDIFEIALIIIIILLLLNIDNNIVKFIRAYGAVEETKLKRGEKRNE